MSLVTVLLSTTSIIPLLSPIRWSNISYNSLAFPMCYRSISSMKKWPCIFQISVIYRAKIRENYGRIISTNNEKRKSLDSIKTEVSNVLSLMSSKQTKEYHTHELGAIEGGKEKNSLSLRHFMHHNSNVLCFECFPFSLF